MKGTYMKTPNLLDIYTQRVSHDLHRKKLEKIRQQRKSHLGFDNNRTNMIQHIKQSKNKSFIHKFNRTNQAINKQNIAFLGKLQRVRPFSRYSNNDSKQKRVNQSFSHVNPYMKRKINEAQQENLRISSRMRSLSSSLNADKLDKDYQRSQQIKKRLQRYVANQNNKIYLKSQKYLDLKKPCSSSRNQSETASQKPKNERKSIASHYNAEQINKNKVPSGTTLLKIRKRYNSRPNTTNEQLLTQNVEQGVGKKQESFFTTEPAKIKALGKRKNINI